MEMNVDTQWILLDQTSDLGRFAHFFTCQIRVNQNVWQLLVN